MNPNMAQTLVRFGKRIANVVAECNYAQRRSFAIMTNPDSYLTDRDQAPDTYAVFLFRTSGGLLHEPATAQRAHGQDGSRSWDTAEAALDSGQAGPARTAQCCGGNEE
jgi:hypothetical protein